MFTSLFQRLSCHAARGPEGRADVPRRRAKLAFAPCLEALEDRTVPSLVFHTIDDPNAGTGPSARQGSLTATQPVGMSDQAKPFCPAIR